MAYYKTQYYEKALKDFNFCIEHTDSIYEELFFNRALVFHALENYPKAIADYKKTVKLNNKYADAYYNLGLVYIEKEMYNKSKSMLNKALKLEPKDSYILANRGYANYKLRLYNEAIKDFQNVLEQNPSINVAYKWIGLSYFKLEQKEKSCFYLRKAKQKGIKNLEEYIEKCN